jgi:hypothetical protein
LLCRYEVCKVPEKQRDGEIKTFERLVAVETWYNLVFAPAPLPRTCVFRKPPEEVFKEWLTTLSGPYPSRPKARAAMQGKLTTRVVDDLWSKNNPRGKGRPRT